MWHDEAAEMTTIIMLSPGRKEQQSTALCYSNTGSGAAVSF